MSPNETALEVVIAKLHQVPQNLRDLYHARIGCAAARDQLTAEAMKSVNWALSTVISRTNSNRSTVGDALDCAAQLTGQWARRAGGSEELAAVARMDALDKMLAENPLTAEACSVLDPLCRERNELVARIESDRIALAEAGAAADRAHQAAISKAIQAANQDPDVLRTRKALQAFEPEAPTPDIVLTRGKIPVGKPDENLLAMLNAD